ncbi:serine/threonine-protein kinase [Roseobacter weihaiensis]|uniref:serine/threonine-protein kinase n=1 Tax=Roseobacter weihaiensis TaxID=2763262 RepID=UPI001D0BBF01|nr:serine/threonine-protein kinase [Roseobacter sp. H9]
MSNDDAKEGQEINADALAPGSKLLSGQYEILRYLSSGGFGITYLARDSLNRTVVIKECFPEAFCSRVKKTVRARTQNYIDDFRSIVQLFIREAHALSKLDHPSVVGVHQVFEDNETAYMALDLIEGKDLLDIIEEDASQIGPEAVRALTLKLLDAIAHVHARDLLHRDISPDNILVEPSGHPVLIDFGAAREEASRKSRMLSAMLVVKDGYSPQEFYVAGSQQHPCSDLYALAATLTHLISGTAPPNSQARLAALASNQPDLYAPLLGRFPQYDGAFLSAIDRCMNIVPAERLQSAEDWALMIDHNKRLEIARAAAQQDKSIDQTVMKLVKSVQDSPDGSPTDGLGQRPGPAPDAPQSAEFLPVQEAQTSDADSLTQQDVLDGPAPADSDASDALISHAADLEETARPEDRGNQVRPEAPAPAPSPYLRVASKAVEAAKAPKAPPPPVITPRRIMRFATVPVVFCAYFFYAQTLFQYEEVQQATLQPLLTFGEGFGGWNDSGASPVTVRRGIGG